MLNNKLTKIIATIGPVSDSEEIIETLIKEGVNIFRFNMKHNTEDWHLERISRVQKIADNLGATIGIMIDLQGPEIRIGTPGGKGVQVYAGEEIVFTSEDLTHNEKKIQLPKLVLDEFIPGVDFSIDDGFHTFCVVKKLDSNNVLAYVREEGFIGDKKSLNLIGVDVPLPSLIDKDLDKLDLASKERIDFIALSFVRSAEDIKILRNEMKIRGIDASVVAKIESQKGIDNIDEIVDETDAVMIARGDLGIETPIEMIAFYQKTLIKICRDKSKPVIVATQMLQSMISSPLPTRAEAADVANAIYDATDAIMLSGETATGKYPVRAVKYMTSTALFNEKYTCKFPVYEPKANDQTHAIVRAGLNIINGDSSILINKIIVFSDSGYTGRVFSSYRPCIPIIVISNKQKTVEKLTMSYGITAYKIDYPINESVDHNDLVDLLKSKKICNQGDTLLIIHGAKWGEPGKTNSVEIKKVG